MPAGAVTNYCLAENFGVNVFPGIVSSGTPVPCYANGYTGP